VKKLSLIAISLSFAATAFANPDPKKAEPAKPADKAAAPADKAAPSTPAPADMQAKPAAELAQLDGMVGTWKCSGTVNVMGKEMKTESTMKYAWDMDKFWMVGNGLEKKQKGMPQYKSHDMIGFDAGKKEFVRMGVDNMGAMSMASTKGWNGDKMEWAGMAKMNGQDMKLMETVTKDASGKQVAIKGHFMAGAQQPVAWDISCKR